MLCIENEAIVNKHSKGDMNQEEQKPANIGLKGSQRRPRIAGFDVALAAPAPYIHHNGYLDLAV